MSERDNTAADSVRSNAASSVERFWSGLNVGALLVVAAGLSAAVHATTGEWPAEFGGVAAALYAVAGAVLVGYSLALADRSGAPTER